MSILTYSPFVIPPPQHIAGEVWKIVPDTNGLYEASNLGRIRKIKGEGLFRILNPKMRTSGLSTVYFVIGDQIKLVKVKDIIARTFIGSCPKNHKVRNKDGNPENNRVDNLEYGIFFPKYSNDQKPTGRSRIPKISRKLSDADIRTILEIGVTNSGLELAEQFNVSPSMISRIRNRKRRLILDNRPRRQPGKT